MNSLILILGDQLSEQLSSLTAAKRDSDILLMCEITSETKYVKHHKKKIAFLFSAMRHFAKRLSEKGYRVTYTRFDDSQNSGSFEGEIARVIEQHDIHRIIITEPGEHRLLEAMKTWSTAFKREVQILADDRFLCPHDEFDTWASKLKQPRMEYFYRQMRVKYDLLMNGGEPVGGEWNYDRQNRVPPKKGLSPPPPYAMERDAITEEVISLVADRFADHFGDLEPFHFAVTREQALEALDHFIKERLPQFGDYQDAMIEGEPWMYHSHLSFYINCGLLLPLECARAAEDAYKSGNAPLNATEGFIRQIIGWRSMSAASIG